LDANSARLRGKKSASGLYQTLSASQLDKKKVRTPPYRAWVAPHPLGSLSPTLGLAVMTRFPWYLGVVGTDGRRAATSARSVQSF
jgi:hypothetical protein